MKNKIDSSKMLLYQGIGFLAIIGISWLDESLNLRTLVLGDHPYISDFRESTFEMLFVLAVWLIVCGSTPPATRQEPRTGKFHARLLVVPADRVQRKPLDAHGRIL